MAPTLDLLIVEDHDALRESLAEVLSSVGYRVLALDSAEAVTETRPARSFDAAILDLNLPGEDGLSLAARLRRIQPGIGIVMLTARVSLNDKLAGYGSGADLYLTKPVTPEELLAALQALTRRLKRAAQGDTPSLELHAGVLRSAGGKLPLRDAEVALLRALALSPEACLEYWQLLEVLDKPLDEDGKRQLAVIISRLRAKLEAHGIPSPALRAERGVGYRLAFPLTIA
mgnify:CR=1 FL=1